MQPSHLNAAQLMMSFLDTEQGKVRKKITTSDFSRELEAEHSKLTSNIPSPSQGTRSEVRRNQRHSAVETAADETRTNRILSGKKKVGNNGKSLDKRTKQTKASRLSREKVKEKLVSTNPLVLERIMGQLQVPAESRQTCMNAADSRGHISINALSSVLAQKAGAEQPKMGKPVIMAEDVRSLVASLQNGQNTQVQPPAQIEVKSSGTYSLEEFRELLDRIVHQVAQAETAEGQLDAPSSQPGAQVESEISEEAGPPAGTSPEQVERLTSTSIPPLFEGKMSGVTGDGDALPTQSPSEAIQPKGPDQAELQAIQRETTPGEPEPEIHTASRAPEGLIHESSQKAQGTAQEKVSLEQNPAQPEPHLVSRAQSTLVESFQQPEPENPLIQVDVSGQKINAGNTPSVNLASSLASVIEGKVSMKYLAGDEAIPQSSSESTGTLTESSAQGQRITPSQGSSLAAWQQGGQMTGDGQGSSRLAPDAQVPEKQGVTLPTWEQATIDLQNNQPLGAVIQGGRDQSGLGTLSAETGDPLSGGPLSFHQASWPESLSQRMRQIYQQGRNEMTLELEPKHLGRLSLRIQTHQNQVTAYISTESEQAKALLLQNSSVLRQHLQDQGLQLGQLFVDVRDDGGHSRQSFQHQGFTARENEDSQKPQSLNKSELAAMSSVYGRNQANSS